MGKDLVKITMLGASRVGKSSLLAAMCDRFNHLIGKTDLRIDLGVANSAIIQDHLAQLKSVETIFESTADVGLEATQAIRKFTFSMGKKGKSASLDFEFTDYPGEYLNGRAQREDQEKVNQLVCECAAVVITIDAPAMMEQDGKWNDMFNRPEQIARMFEKAYDELEEPRLVLFAPVKCEKYSSPEQAEMLRKKIKFTYSALITFLKEKKDVVVVITPVQTIGTVIYSHTRVKDGKPRFYFQKINHEAKYDPHDSEQPLRYLLRFFLKLHYEKRADRWWVFRFLHDWLKLDTHLLTAIQKFTDGCKDEKDESKAFEIIQKNKWI